MNLIPSMYFIPVKGNSDITRVNVIFIDRDKVGGENPYVPFQEMSFYMKANITTVDESNMRRFLATMLNTLSEQLEPHDYYCFPVVEGPFDSPTPV